MLITLLVGKYIENQAIGPNSNNIGQPSPILASTTTLTFRKWSFSPGTFVLFSKVNNYAATWSRHLVPDRASAEDEEGVENLSI